MIIMGTRPEAIKLCPLVLELKKRQGFKVSVCAVEQHSDMLRSVLETFGVKADFVLEIDRSHQSVGVLTALILGRVSHLLSAERPDLVLVQGDTATAFAAGLAAFYERIPVGHVEAGLRTYRLDAPFPEELHRRALSLFAKYHFAPTALSKRNLLREGIAESSVFKTGNTSVDALRMSLLGDLGDTSASLPAGKRLILFTAHRRESIGKPLFGMLRALCRVVEETPDVIALCPLHPNPQIRKIADEVLSGADRIRVIEPPGFVDFHHLLSKSYLVLTDSGGIQEETVTLGIPTVVMRYSSERTEGMYAGVLRLVGSGEEGIYEVVKRLLEQDSPEYAAMKKPSSVFGDGKASARIADLLEKSS
jgi:UDP-N-acetylglucosamine 2-epimerase (non-hydrolysing)